MSPRPAPLEPAPLGPAPLGPAPLGLSPISLDRFPAWVARSISEYATDLVQTGLSPSEAHRSAAESMAAEFPNDAPSRDSAVFDLVAHDGANVGYLWVGRDRSPDPTAWWVWDIVVDADRRREGHGRAAMRLAEEYARSRGAASLGLSVFRFNTAALALYESLGYEARTSEVAGIEAKSSGSSTIKMSKRL